MNAFNVWEGLGDDKRLIRNASRNGVVHLASVEEERKHRGGWGWLEGGKID